MKTVKLMNRSTANMSIKINVDKLELIQKALGVRLRAQVGVLGSSPHNRSVVAPRQPSEKQGKGLGRPNSLGANPTNAEIGAQHEFGNIGRHLPQRSFLWMPLSLYLNDYVQKKASVLNRLITLAKIQEAYAVLGIAGENVVQAAFQTGGFGNWQALKLSTLERKHPEGFSGFTERDNDSILIQTGQLRKSITSRVV